MDLPIHESSKRRSSSLFFLGFSYLSIVFVFIQGIVLVPLYLTQISPELYGGWLASGNLLSYLSFFDFGFSTVINQQVAKAYGAKDLNKLSRISGTGIVIGAFLSACIIILGIILAYFSPFWVNIAKQDYGTLRLAVTLSAISTGLTIFAYFIASQTLALQRAFSVGLINNVSWCLGIFVIFVNLSNGIGLVSIPIGYLARAVVCVIALVVHFIYSWKIDVKTKMLFDREQLKNLGSISSFVFIGRVGATIIGQSDALITATLLGPAQTTILSLTNRAKDAIQAIPDRIASSVIPGLAHLSGEGNLARTKQISIDVLSISLGLASLCAAGIVGLNASFVQLWVGSQFFGGQWLTVGIGVYFILNIYRNAISNLLLAIGEVKIPSLLNLLEAVVRVVLVIFCTIWLGLFGTVIGAILSLLLVNVYFLTQIFIGNFMLVREDFVKRGWAILGYPIVSFMIGIIWMFLPMASSWLQFIVQGIIFAIILIMLLLWMNLDIRRQAKIILDRVIFLSPYSSHLKR